MKPITVTFFGDSICVGQYVSLHNGWVPRMSAKLSELGEVHGRRVIVGNASANGRTTRQALEQMPYEIQSQDIDILIVQFGMNDCNHWESDHGVPRVSERAFAANLEEIVARAYRSGVGRVFLNTNHPTCRDTDALPGTMTSYEEWNQRYNNLIRETARRVGPPTKLNDVARACQEFADGDHERLEQLVLPAPDLVHLSEKGHDLYLSVVHPQLEAAVLELFSTEAS